MPRHVSYGATFTAIHALQRSEWRQKMSQFVAVPVSAYAFIPATKEFYRKVPIVRFASPDDADSLQDHVLLCEADDREIWWKVDTS